MKTHKKATRLGLVLLFLLAFSAVAVAAPAPGVLAEIENTGNALIFFPVVEYAELILTVTGPCDYQFSKAFSRGEPFFKLDEETIDGVYTFNLTRNEKIDPEIVSILKDARFQNDTETPKALCREGLLPAAPLSQSNGFLVSQGRIIYDDREPEDFGQSPSEAGNSGLGASSGGGLQAMDFVINDDLIVDGSACIGFDCVNGESFGFDTVRLKEHNLRIKFDDTSTASSFPRNDWQLTANDSANGGASKFSIDDISGNRTPFTVEANARSHSLYVDDGGRIGNRTSTPSTEIHTIDGDTPTLRLQQDGSSGFAPQTWDVAGNETNFFIRDVTNGSTLPFRIRPGAPTSSIFIDVDGEVGIGTASPAGGLDINGDNNASFIFNPGAANTNVVELQNNANNNMFTVFETGGGGAQFSMFDGGASERFRMTTTGGDNRMSGNLGLGCNGATEDLTVNSSANAGTTTCGTGTESTISAGATQFTVTSSRTIKENLDPVEADGILEKISSVGVYKYDFIEGPKDRLGLMAEDFHQIFERGSDTRLNGQEIQMAMWLAIQELAEQNQTLLEKISELEASLP